MTDPAVAATRTDPLPSLTRLVWVVDALRENCGWTGRLNPERLAPYLLEEAAEVSETVAAGQLGGALASELGDVLFQIMLHSRLAEERSDFTLTDVIEALESKLLRRNTHVFTSEGALKDQPDHDPQAAERAWQEAKEAERAARAGRAAAGPAGLSSSVGPAPSAGPSHVEAAASLDERGQDKRDPLQGLPASLSALSLAQKALGRAEGSLSAFGSGPEQQDDAAGRLGDEILAKVREARVLGVDADRALRDALVRHLSQDKQ